MGSFISPYDKNTDTDTASKRNCKKEDAKQAVSVARTQTKANSKPQAEQKQQIEKNVAAQQKEEEKKSDAETITGDTAMDPQEIPPELQLINTYFVKNTEKERNTDEDRNTNFKDQSKKPPLTLKVLLKARNEDGTKFRYRSFFDHLKFKSDDELFQLDGEIDKNGYSQCPKEDADIEAYFDKLASLQITEVQTKERMLGTAPHHFNELNSTNHMIYIEFWGDSTLSVSIRTKPCEQYADFRVVSTRRKVDDNLRYWVRKALSHWTEYSLLLMNCQDQARAIIVPNSSSAIIEEFPKLRLYFVNLPKNILKGMTLYGAHYSGRD